MTDDRHAVLRVRTPEGVSFAFPLASPVIRLAAWVVDQATISAAWTLISMILALAGLLGRDVAAGVVTVGYFVLSTGYFMAMEWVWHGQTLGKRLLHLRVMDEQGLPLQPSQLVVRNLLRSVDVLPIAYLVGGVTALINRKAQRLGDIAAATIVVHEPPPPETALAGLGASKYNSLRGQQHLAARIRNGVGPELAQVALQALLRRDDLEAGARVELFARLTEHLRSVVSLPEEYTEGISNEQFVRNVVELVYGIREKPATKAA